MITQEVQYNHAEHRYYMGNITYRSATQIVEQFRDHFDTEERSAYMEHRYGQTQEYWKQNWKDGNAVSLVRGNNLHDTQEQFLYNREYSRIHNKTFPVFNMRRVFHSHLDYRRMPDGVYPEMKLWRHDWHIAGRVDKPTLETLDNIRYAHIEDYKTNKRIRKEGFNGRKMLYCLSHLDDCEWVHYTLQLSIYQYMLEYFDFQPGVRRIIHFPHEIEGLGVPNPVPYELPYLREEVINMLGYLKYTHWLN